MARGAGKYKTRLGKLSDRQRKTLIYWAVYFSNSAIAEAMGVTARAVEDALLGACNNLAVLKPSEAYAKAVKLGLIGAEERPPDP